MAALVIQNGSLLGTTMQISTYTHMLQQYSDSQLQDPKYQDVMHRSAASVHHELCTEKVCSEQSRLHTSLPHINF